jgi:hypothetical protein
LKRKLKEPRLSYPTAKQTSVTDSSPAAVIMKWRQKRAPRRLLQPQPLAEARGQKVPRAAQPAEGVVIDQTAGGNQ